MYRNNKNQEYSYQLNYIETGDDPDNAIPIKKSTGLRPTQKVEFWFTLRGWINAADRHALDCQSDQIGPIGRCASELIALLRYTTFLPQGVIERWSRKIREMDIEQPKRGIALLDELITDYWSVYLAYKPNENLRTSLKTENPNYAVEMGKIKSKLDLLGETLIKVQIENPGSQ